MKANATTRPPAQNLVSSCLALQQPIWESCCAFARLRSLLHTSVCCHHQHHYHYHYHHHHPPRLPPTPLQPCQSIPPTTAVVVSFRFQAWMSSDQTRLADSLLHTLQSAESPKPPSNNASATTPTITATTTTTSFSSSGRGEAHPAGLEPPQAPAQARMRSSIACIRCRRSKVKCVNSGIGRPCRSCENTGRECVYPSPVTPATRRRDSLSGGQDGAGNGERRQRPRKSVQSFVGNTSSSSVKEAPRPPSQDALDSRLLTPAVWQELFDIFQIHYSADLPFLHPPTFLKPLRQANAQPQPTPAAPNDAPTGPRPAACPEFLLAFLALTARFHPKLVAHHSPPTSARPSNPLIAAEYYATAAAVQLSSHWDDNDLQDIERIQSMLMIGLHQWGMCTGAKAWLGIGTAIRQAQAMGLQYELDLDDEPLSRSLALNGEAEKLGIDTRKSSLTGAQDENDAFTQQEIRRRTFWSCFIMDRYLSSGKYRPQMLQVKDLRIQLPASERSFLFAEKVRTLMLGEEEQSVAGRAEVQSHRQASLGITAAAESNGIVHDTNDDKMQLQVGADEGLVSRYIKILEIYGKVVKWSCGGGRRYFKHVPQRLSPANHTHRTEKYPPWDPRCEFHQLQKQCLEFKNSLPRHNTLTPQNTQAHISLKTSTPYTLIHAVYLLCQIALHREYIPFVPIRCDKPQGPLDPPLFTSDKYDVPLGFWEDSARECFKSARAIVDLFRTCQEWNVLVETPIIGFAIYTVSFMGVYCINFPHMDPGGFMCTPKDQQKKGGDVKSKESKGFEAARKALEMLGQMRIKLHMADGWFKTINRVHKYLRRLKSDYKKNVAAIESSASESDSPMLSRHLSIREGGIGGGLDEFKLLELTLKEFGSLEDRDSPMEDVPSRPDTRALDAVYDDSGSGTTVKSEDHDRAQPAASEPARPESGLWNAINAAPGAAASSSHSDSAQPTTNGHFRSYDSYPQPLQQHSQARPISQPNYAHQINNFRPTYSHDGASAAPPSLTSPNSLSATTPSDPSPSFERQAQPYNPHWPAQNSLYPLQPTQQPQNFSTDFVHPAQHQQIQSHVSPYASAVHSQLPPLMQPASSQMEILQHQPWNQREKEDWLNSLDTRLGGDDLAAFVDGGELADWAQMSANRGYGGGWLSTVWGDGNDGAGFG